MNTFCRRIGISMSLLAGVSMPAGADTLYEHVNGYTSDAARRIVHFDALAVNDQGKVLASGTRAALRKQYPAAHRVDMKGLTMLPGLTDAHGHIFGLGESLGMLNLRATASLSEAQQAIRDYAGKHADQAWILGGEWNQENWKLGRFPAAADIDAVVADQAVWLSRVDGHAGWANSKALQLAGITAQTPDPVGGKIERDADGKPTGVLVDSAMTLVYRVVPPMSDSAGRQAVDRALQNLISQGLTSVHDAGVSEEADRIFRDYAMQGKLPLRIYGMISGAGDFFEHISARGPLKTMADDHYALRAVKLFADGALGSRGAALLAPYSDAPATQGLLFHSATDIEAMISKAAQKGYQVNVHAIGDAGNRQILNAFAKLPAAERAALRNRIEHAQVVALEDIPRFHELGVIPSMQPTHATSDMNMAENRVGHERIMGAYAWQRFLRQGSRIACGSDFPVESPNPFLGIYAAVTRQNTDAQPEGGWYINQAMSLVEAFRCFTIDAAYAAHQEKTLGSLEPGKWADFIIIDRDLMRIPASQIPQIQVLQTWVAGKRVYQRSP